MNRDPRIDKMARILATHSLKIQKNDKVLIDATDECDELIVAMLEKIREIGAIPYVQHQSLRVRRAWLLGATAAQFDLWYEQQVSLRLEMDCILSLRGQDNCCELIDVPAETMRTYTNLNINIGMNARKPGRRSTVIRYPSRSLAQQSGMSLEAFTDLFYRVCAMNYEVLHREMEPLKAAIDAANQVHIIAPGTDLEFSIKDLECSISAGTWNVPDGETAMGIVRESANGRIAYNIPSNHQGFIYKDIALTLKDGRIAEVEASECERMEAILDTDEGARYIGEFAIGVNPYLLTHMTDTLFDEKMAGSLHFTPAGTDSEGNRSLVHWDIIQSHLPHYGGGEIYLDEKLWRKDGLFVDDHMQHLNPDNLRETMDSAESL
jgi:aminopeptidase